MHNRVLNTITCLPLFVYRILLLSVHRRGDSGEELLGNLQVEVNIKIQHTWDGLPMQLRQPQSSEGKMDSSDQDHDLKVNINCLVL